MGGINTEQISKKTTDENRWVDKSRGAKAAYARGDGGDWPGVPRK